MYEPIQISEHSNYLDCPAKIGLLRLNDLQEQSGCRIENSRLFCQCEANTAPLNYKQVQT